MTSTWRDLRLAQVPISANIRGVQGLGGQILRRDARLPTHDVVVLAENHQDW